MSRINIAIPETERDIGTISSNNNEFQNQISILKENNQDNQKLNELIAYLTRFKDEYQDSITKKNKIKNISFHINLFQNLHKLLCELSYIESKEIFNLKLDKIYYWFTHTIKGEKSIAQISQYTNPLPDEILTEEELNIDNPHYQERQKEIFITKQNAVSHRTILNNIAKPSELIQSLETRTIMPKLSNRDSKIPIKDIFSSSIGMKSTFYSTAKSTNNIFVHDTNFNKKKSIVFEPKQEIKSSYSYLRPRFSFGQLSIEKMIMEQKNKVLQEKRANEEIGAYIVHFGQNKSRYKSDIQKKYEIGSLIELYDKKLKEEEDENEKNDTINEDEEDLKDYFEKGGREIEKKKSYGSIHLKNQIRNPTKFTRTYSTIDPMLDMHKIKKPKVIITNVKNMNKKNHIYKSENEKEYTIYTKVNKIEVKDKTYDYLMKKDEHNLPGEVLLQEKRNNKILNERVNNQKICSVKSTDPLKTIYHNYYFPLSGYDSMNYSSFHNNRYKYQRNSRQNNIIKSNSTTCVDFAKEHFNYDNYLEVRSTMSSFKMNELRKLKASRSLGKRIIIRNSKRIKSLKHLQDDNIIDMKSLENAFLTPTSQKAYPQMYLPKSVSGLLSLPIDYGTKNKKNTIE